MSVTDLVAANNQFGFDLLARLTAGEPEKNVFISPASMALALSMTANGADDPTSQAMLNLLRLTGLDWTAVNQSHAALWQALDGVDPQVTLSMANSLWAEMGFPFKTAFRDAVRNYYEAEITNLDFGDTETAAQTINRWVEDKTRNKIKNLLNPGDLVTAVLVLVNAIYFKGAWAATFDKGQTKDGDFYLADNTTKSLPLMSRKGDYHYRETADYQLISLPFGQGQLSFVVFLPAADKTLAQVQPTLTASNWTETVGRLIPHPSRPEQGWQPGLAEFGRQKGTIILPRFKIEYEKSLLGHLVGMGLTANNFNRMAEAESFFISKVIHKTFLEVNEEGAEAAAATAVIMARSIPPPPFRMVVDRPFFCAIQDNLTGAILFMGTIYEPGETGDS